MCVAVFFSLASLCLMDVYLGKYSYRNSRTLTFKGCTKCNNELQRTAYSESASKFARKIIWKCLISKWLLDMISAHSNHSSRTDWQHTHLFIAIRKLLCLYHFNMFAGHCNRFTSKFFIVHYFSFHQNSYRHLWSQLDRYDWYWNMVDNSIFSYFIFYSIPDVLFFGIVHKNMKSLLYSFRMSCKCTGKERGNGFFVSWAKELSPYKVSFQSVWLNFTPNKNLYANKTTIKVFYK